jgi:glycosyltransferase involved in cell wall biosynthesis
MHVLLVEPFYGGSHRAWADGLARHSRHEVTLVTHEAAFWRWRLRGGALTLAHDVAAAIDARGVPEVVVVSDLVDLSSLLGLCRRVLPPETPVALYLHESQLLHPATPRQRSVDTGAAMQNWLSMAAADHVFCNSRFHRDALVAALPPLLDGAPDHHHTAWVDEVAARMSVLPVGVELAGLVDGSRTSAFDRAEGPPLIVWNQRWDHDKDPSRFLRLLVKLAEYGVAFSVALAGENTRHDPREFSEAIDVLGERVVHVGFLSRPDYVELLLRSDVVVSTARHEFFGVAVVEAMAAGCVPLLPDRLAYPELVPGELRRACLYRARPYQRLQAILEDLDGARAAVAGLRNALRRFGWETMGPRYDDALAALVAPGAPARSG